MAWRFAEITKGMTQEQIAEKLECSVGQVNMMLSGKRKFHTIWISRIAKAWDIQEWQLFTTGEEIYGAKERAIVEAYYKASKRRRETVDELLGIEDLASADNEQAIIDTKKNKHRSFKRMSQR